MDKKELQILLGKRIRFLRESKDLAQHDFSSMCNFEKSNYNRIESGNTNPTIYTLSIIADNLEISLSELFKF